MKNNCIIYAAVLATTLLAACSGNHKASDGVDSAKSGLVNNPYRDTFKTTKTYGDATTLDNSGNGGATIARPATQTAKPVAAKPDSVKE